MTIIEVNEVRECSDKKLSFKKCVRKAVDCDLNTVKKRLPILKWAPKYRPNFLIYDLIAGITVALTAIPQGIAYAVLAGLEPQYGLYSEIMPGLVYMIFGSCNYMTIGPTAIMALMVEPHVELSIDFAFLASFFTGCIILLLGVFKLGFLVEFISAPVTAGFTAAACTTIASAQIKSLINIPGGSSTFLGSWINLFKNFQKLQIWDTLLGISTIVMLLLLKRLGRVKKFPVLTKYVSLSRNAIVVILGTLIAFLFKKFSGSIPFVVTGNIGSELPSFQPPAFTTEVGNSTYYFMDMVEELGTSIIAIPIVSILEIFIVAKSFAKGSLIDASQEMTALGMTNIMGSFVSAMPVTGSLTRTALNHASGVKTTFGGVFTTIIVSLALGLLTETFYFIPKSVLAGVIISAVMAMIEYDIVIKLWSIKKLDLIPFTVTLLVCLFFGLDLGIVIGVCVNLLFILQKTARPQIEADIIICSENRTLLMITPDQSLFFSAAEYLRMRSLKLINEKMHSQSDVILINGSQVQHIDSTAGKSMITLCDDLQFMGKKVYLWNFQKQPIKVILKTNPNSESLFRFGVDPEEDWF